MRNLERARDQMVGQLLVHRGVHDAGKPEAMGTGACQKFIEEGSIEFAYEDSLHQFKWPRDFTTGIWTAKKGRKS